jgi:hypothetical protein
MLPLNYPRIQPLLIWEQPPGDLHPEHIPRRAGISQYLKKKIPYRASGSFR